MKATPLRHVGILGHSLEGAALCFRALGHAGFRELGPNRHPRVTLDCIASGRSMEAWEVSDYTAIRSTLATSAQALAQAGATFFVCPDNSCHLCLELPGEDLAIPGLHIADAVAESAVTFGYTRVGVLGTRHTMEGPIYSRVLEAHSIEAHVPSQDDRRIVDRIIEEELVRGIFTERSREIYVRIIDEMRSDGCDAVALVCTEIPLLISPGVSPLPTLDSTALLAQAGFDVATDRRPMPTWHGGPPRSGPVDPTFVGRPANS